MLWRWTIHVVFVHKCANTVLQRDKRFLGFIYSNKLFTSSHTIKSLKNRLVLLTVSYNILFISVLARLAAFLQKC
jgi:hypothetical protein